MSNSTPPQLQDKGATEILEEALQRLESLTTTMRTTTSDTASTTKEVVEKIIQGSNLIKSDAQELDDYVYQAWTGIFDIVGKTAPEGQQQQQPIIDVLLDLRRSTIYPDDETGNNNDATQEQRKPVTVQGDGVLWRDLPTFGWVARDLWNFTPYDTKATQADQTKWANWTAFLAKLTAISLSDKAKLENADNSGTGNRADALDFSNFALWSLRDAFEEDQRPQPQDLKNDPSTTAIKLAAIWILHAGRELKLAAEKGVSLAQAQGRGGGSFAARGWSGFNAERWGLWREGFLAAAAATDAGASDTGSSSEVDQGVREMARKAAEVMA